jgi:hypothetical protein
VIWSWARRVCNRCKVSFSPYFWILTLALAPCAGASRPAARSISRSKKEVQTATEIRLQDPGWWPTKGSAAREEYVGPALCVRCHPDEANTQLTTPMADALTAASAGAFPEISSGPIRFGIGPYNYELSPTTSGASYAVTDGTRSMSVPVSWIFGHGGFGRTYVYRQSESFYESRLSYYSAVHSLDFTTGNPRSVPNRLETALGRRMSRSEPGSCFACHATAARTSNRFDPEHLIPGVSCEACHGPGAEHVAEMNLGNQQSPSLIMNPARLGPVDSVDFCGACHRTSVDVALTGVTGILTLRFPAFRLERSRCWGSGDARLTCTACHNPHQSLVRDPEAYDHNCLSCHARKSTSKPGLGARDPGSPPLPTKPELVRGPACPVGQASCVTCHMPKYTIPEMHATFTDHKIAVVRSQKSFAD